MGYLAYTRDYNTLTLKIPQIQSIIYDYYYYTLEIKINGKLDTEQSVSNRTQIPVEGATKTITGYHPLSIQSCTVTWYLSETSTTTKSETIIYHWPLDGHILLGGKGQYLPLLYNPEVTNLKWNHIDTVTPTLGGSYPVVTRNGQQKYRTFTLGGMLSYEMDLPQKNLFRGYQFISETDIEAYQNLGINVDEQNLLIERRFRDAAAAWLQNGQKKVFQSEQEGTMIVYLSNFSWTSNKTLGRNIYSFSCTATEVEEATDANIGEALA